MDTYYDYSNATRQESSRQLTTWTAFLLGAIFTFLLVYVGIARPLTLELAGLRQHVKLLESAVQKVAGQSHSARETTSILASLVDQADLIDEARASVSELRELQQRLIHESRETQKAISAVAELAALKDTLLANATRTDEAASVVATSEMIYDRLASAAESSQTALEVGNNLLLLGEELLLRGHDVEAANVTLNSLVEMRDALQREDASMQVARNRVADLLNLKDAIVTQTDDLADAIATMEATADLKSQFEEASRAFQQIRLWMVEVVATEPLLARARYALEPLTDIVNLRRLQPDDLREMARHVSQQFQSRLARVPEAASRDALLEPTATEAR